MQLTENVVSTHTINVLCKYPKNESLSLSLHFNCIQIISHNHIMFGGPECLHKCLDTPVKYSPAIIEFSPTSFQTLLDSQLVAGNV